MWITGAFGLKKLLGRSLGLEIRAVLVACLILYDPGWGFAAIFPSGISEWQLGSFVHDLDIFDVRVQAISLLSGNLFEDSQMF